MSASVQVSKTELDWLFGMSHRRFSVLIIQTGSAEPELEEVRNAWFALTSMRN
jgi:hypothetical protein